MNKPCGVDIDLGFRFELNQGVKLTFSPVETTVRYDHI